jgi:hypothetical protein
MAMVTLDSDQLWTHARDRWESSHVIRAVLGVVALTAVSVAVAV